MGKINVYDKIMIENYKKRKYGNKRNFYININPIDGEWNSQLAKSS